MLMQARAAGPHERIQQTPATLMFLHAAGLAAAMWRPQAGHLQDRFTVMAVDLPGHGSRASQPFTFTAAVDCVRQSLQALGQPVTLIGASQGGYVAAMAAAMHPELVDALVLSGVQPRVHGWMALKCRFAAATDAAGVALLTRLRPSLFDRIITRTLVTQVGADIAAGIIQSGLRPTARAECLRALASTDLRPFLGSYHGPVLILQGGQDRPAVKDTPQFAALAPQAIVKTIPGAGHLASIHAPEQFSAMVAEFASAQPQHSN
jgi:pimeloyl-ACP methyl ester carboxylesterase